MMLFIIKYDFIHVLFFIHSMFMSGRTFSCFLCHAVDWEAEINFLLSRK